MKKQLSYFISLSLIVLACSKSGDQTQSTIDQQSPDAPPVRPQGLHGLVLNVGGNIIYPAYQKLAGEVSSLKEEIDRQCSQDPITNIDRNPLKNKFLSSIKAYHFTEVFQIGTVAEEGFKLRELMYPWPSSNPFLIDKEIAQRGQNPQYQFTVHPTAMGLPALEYLIYEETLVNNCSGCGIDEMEAWNNMSDADKLKTRCNYMQFAADELQQNAEKIRREWEPVENDITLSSTYQKNFKEVQTFALKLAQGLNFIDQEVKNHRLGIPSGINYTHCGYDSCPERSEHIRSKASIQSLISTMKGAYSVFTGNTFSENLQLVNDGYSYEEWLRERGFGELAQKMSEALASTINNLENIDASTTIADLATGINYDMCERTTTENRIAEICALYKDVNKFADLYKGDFLAASDFALPISHGGDGDGN